MSLKLLILGGSGFVSGHLARMALARGHEVWTVTRGNGALPAGVHPIFADRADAGALARALEEAGTHWDACLDCICFSAAHAETDLRVLTGRADRLIVISTDSVYDPFHKTVPQTEEADCYMRDGGYGANKRLAEEYFLSHRDDRLPWTIFRPGHIYGPGSKPGCFPENSRQDDLPDRIRAGEPMRLVGGGTYLIHPVYVGDLCAAMLESIGLPAARNQIFCIGGPEILPNADYYRILGELLGCPVTVETIPETGYLEAHPECSGHLCHRAYDLTKMKKAGFTLPATTLWEGLRYLTETDTKTE